METVTEQRSSNYNAVNRVVGSSPEVVEKASRAIDAVCEGIPLKHALQKVALTRDLFASCLSGQRELSLRYARAREISADFLVDEALHVVQTEENQMKARNIADMHRWAAAKFNSKRYGDRIDLNVTQSLDISGTLLEARQRMLRPMRDQLDIVDAETVDVSSVAQLGAQDSQSLALAEPDIFAQPEPVAIDRLPGDDVPDIFS